MYNVNIIFKIINIIIYWYIIIINECIFKTLNVENNEWYNIKHYLIYVKGKKS